ncbi:MAG: hypothetical protein H7311_13655 [Ramlibacter sp.]|nr:hypothetical protein [Cryobacterium sp.]
MSLPPADPQPSDPPASGTPAPDETGEPQRSGPSRNRILVWIIAGGAGLYLIGTGLYGILVK